MNPLKVFLLIISLIIIVNTQEEEKENYVCNQYTCPYARGRCKDDNKCYCMNGFITFGDSEIKCNYKQKTKAKAFFLEFVLGFGIGHIYMGNLALALTKLIFSAVACYFICFTPSFKKADFLYSVAKILHVLLGIAWALWQIIDAIMILSGKYKDQNGFDLLGL